MATAASTAALTLLSLKPHLLSCISTNRIPSFPPLYTHLSLLSRRTITPSKCRRRDEEEQFGRRRRRRRRWWEETPPSMEMDGGVLEQVVGSLWIFKVVRFYGWWLSPILISMLLATGPKAFLLAFASTMGLSLLILAFTKLQGLINSPNRRFRSKKKKKTKEYEEEYRSWVSFDGEKSNSEEDFSDFSDFRGWDEIGGEEVFSERTTRRDARRSRPRREKSFTRRERGDEMPLLLRLLVAVFPFWGSWTKML